MNGGQHVVAAAENIRYVYNLIRRQNVLQDCVHQTKDRRMHHPYLQLMPRMFLDAVR